jgi:geranylgeranyl diphosphate synthase, type III
MDLYWRDGLVCPTEEEYEKMVLNKTGGLFRLAIRLMMLAAGEKRCVFFFLSPMRLWAMEMMERLMMMMDGCRDFVPLVNTLGVIFQIRDDYLNLQSDAYATNKGFGEDLTEGKFSFPVIHSIRASPPDDRRLLNILKQRTEDVDVKRYAIGRIEATGSFEYTRQRIKALMEEAMRQAREIGDAKEGCEREECEMGIRRIVGMIGLEV